MLPQLNFLKLAFEKLVQDGLVYVITIYVCLRTLVVSLPRRSIEVSIVISVVVIILLYDLTLCSFLGVLALLKLW